MRTVKENIILLLVSKRGDLSYAEIAWGRKKKDRENLFCCTIHEFNSIIYMVTFMNNLIYN